MCRLKLIQIILLLYVMFVVEYWCCTQCRDFSSIHFPQMTPYWEMEQLIVDHWCRWWLVASWCQATTWTIADIGRAKIINTLSFQLDEPSFQPKCNWILLMIDILLVHRSTAFIMLQFTNWQFASSANPYLIYPVVMSIYQITSVDEYLIWNNFYISDSK